MIDSHCHLDFEFLYNDIDNVILRAKNVGIKKLLTICTTNKSFETIKKLIKKDQIIYGTFGIHPHETETNIVNTKDIIERTNFDQKIIGIGETGLDFFYNHSNKQAQIKSFKSHIEASIFLNKPLIIHSRNAETETYEILKNYDHRKVKILMHCFTGSIEFSQKLLSLGAFFSASGIITFKNSSLLRETFKSIPDNRILIETDSPYLAPVPMRGKNNEPSFLQHTAKELSFIKDKTIEEIVNLTTKNFNHLFNIL
jgi:TatD DNase family protein